MTFSTENRTINSIFQRAAVYTVPRYQRDYVWKEVNWKELWIDLQFTLENSEEIPWSHFLGTIVLNQSKTSEDGLEKYEIIDGQQRMMTIYMLLIAIYKNYKKLPEDSPGNSSKYIYESFLTSLTKGAKRKLIIDNEIYNDDIKSIIDAVRKGEKVEKITNCILYFYILIII